jgi:TusA-related sulfurtransferase
MSQVFDKMLDARGQNCPMPLVNARKEVGKLEVGQVLKVVATDRGSLADFQGWAKVAKTWSWSARRRNPTAAPTCTSTT